MCNVLRALWSADEGCVDPSDHKSVIFNIFDCLGLKLLHVWYVARTNKQSLLNVTFGQADGEVNGSNTTV